MHCTPLDRQTTRNRTSEEPPPNRSADLALVWELGANRVIDDPTKARERHENGLFTQHIPIHTAEEGNI
jgi:hypothetical protein